MLIFRNFSPWKGILFPLYLLLDQYLQKIMSFVFRFQSDMAMTSESDHTYQMIELVELRNP